MDKTVERKQITVTQVKEVETVGEKSIPKLTFYATYPNAEKPAKFDTFRSSLFEYIKVDAVLDADIQVSSREYEGNTYIDRRINQIYVDGQPIGGKKQGQFYKSKSPEELDFDARCYALSYSKDLCVADKIKVGEIIKQAEKFYPWLKGIGDERISKDDKTDTDKSDSSEKQGPGQSSGEKTGKDLRWLYDEIRQHAIGCAKLPDEGIEALLMNYYKSIKTKYPPTNIEAAYQLIRKYKIDKNEWKE